MGCWEGDLCSSVRTRGSGVQKPGSQLMPLTVTRMAMQMENTEVHGLGGSYMLSREQTAGYKYFVVVETADKALEEC
jgi:hypothetical protein